MELLAGYPFHISPAELTRMTGPQLTWWVERAKTRLERENAG